MSCWSKGLCSELNEVLLLFKFEKLGNILNRCIDNSFTFAYWYNSLIKLILFASTILVFLIELKNLELAFVLRLAACKTTLILYTFPYTNFLGLIFLFFGISSLQLLNQFNLPIFNSHLAVILAYFLRWSR